MKKIALILLLSNCCCGAFAQSLADFNYKRLETNKKAMLVLGTWAVGNIAVGATLMGKAEGEQKYFHQMNAGWNLVNLGLAAAGYYAAAKADPASFDAFNTLQEQYGVQKILLFNAGLDVGYMLGGLYLIERSKRTEKKPERLKGFGQSILLQGAFLFAFDLGANFFHAKNNEGLRSLPGLLSFNGQGLSWTLAF